MKILWWAVGMAALALILSAALPAHARNVCREAGLRGVALMNCSMRHYLPCRSGQRATQFSAHGRLYCGHTNARFLMAEKHPQCGARRRVTNVRTGRSIVATVVDKGPGTIASYDLDHALARALGMGSGSGCVLVARE